MLGSFPNIILCLSFDEYDFNRGLEYYIARETSNVGKIKIAR